MLVAYFDGECSPINPGGTMGIGAIILKAKEGNTYLDFINKAPSESLEQIYTYSSCIHNGEKGFKQTTNNIAEYLGVIKILEYIIKINYRDNVLIMGDSKLIINQLNKEWEIRHGACAKYAFQAQDLLKKLNNKYIWFKWIPRELNTLADSLSKKSIVDARNESIIWTQKHELLSFINSCTDHNKINSLYQMIK